MLHAVRNFFHGRGYLEVETPHLIVELSPEVYTDALTAGDRYLHTSPELCMKRIIASGYPRIFQICRCFRPGERGQTHLPEFTMLEWYRQGIGYKELMEDCESLISFTAEALGIGSRVSCQGMEIDLAPPWERLAVRDAFSRYAAMNMDKALNEECFDEIMVRDIEPNLGAEKPVFLFDYPAPLASLAKVKTDEPALSERFELYVGKLELANGYSELNDPAEQRLRFQRDLEARNQAGRPLYPMPERFLDSLSRMPRAAGIAMGMDRLAMVFTDRANIDDVVSFAPEEL